MLWLENSEKCARASNISPSLDKEGLPTRTVSRNDFDLNYIYKQTKFENTIQIAIVLCDSACISEGWLYYHKRYGQIRVSSVYKFPSAQSSVFVQ